MLELVTEVEETDVEAALVVLLVLAPPVESVELDTDLLDRLEEELVERFLE